MSAKDSLQQPAPRTSAVPVTEWLERFALVLVWAATIAVFGALRPETFLTWSTFSTILGSQAVIVILALGLVVFDVWYFTRDPRAASPVKGPAVARPRMPERGQP